LAEIRKDKQLNDRDTQFAGFASLVLSDILKECERYIWNEQMLDIESEDCRDQIIGIIAHSAYDLAAHVISNIVPNDLQESSHKKSIAEIAQTIPDMAETEISPP